MSDVILNPLAKREAVKRLCDETRALAERYLTGKYQFRLGDAGFRLKEPGLPEETPPEIRHGKNTLLTAAILMIQHGRV